MVESQPTALTTWPRPPTALLYYTIKKFNEIIKFFKIFGLSRNRTYIENLEGFCPNPLDDKPK
tara:strand:+ start:218 stop:406 length:189 start_codon:yes stop_codon:yes gene_type:complete